MSIKVEIYEKLTEIITTDPKPWPEIVAEIKTAKIDVKNWLVVRGVIQFMINEGMIARVDDIFVEKYYKL